MLKAALSLACAVLFWSVGSVWAGEAAPAPAPAPGAETPKKEEGAAKAAPEAPKPPAADADALKKQAAALKEKAKGIQAKLDEAYAKIKTAPDLAKIAEAESKAAKAYDEARRADKDYTAATQAGLEAMAAIEKVVQEKLAASDQAKPLLAELAGAAKKRADLEYDEALAKLELSHESSPINFALDHDSALAKTKKAAYETADKEARAKALKAYDDARKAKRDAMPDAQKALARIETDKKERDELRKAESAARTKLSELRHTIEKSDEADVKAARDRMAATYQAREDASNSEALKAVRKARDEASTAYDAKRKELLAADPNVAALKKERDALRDQVTELGEKIRAAAK